MSAMPSILSPASALLHAAPAGLTVRELQIACLGHAPTDEQRTELQRQLDEFARDGKAVFIRGTDRWHWQQRRTETKTNGSAAPARREQEGAERFSAAPSPRSAPPPPAVDKPAAKSAAAARRGPTSKRDKPTPLTETIIGVFAVAGRPLWSREVCAALQGRSNANSVAAMLGQLCRRGVLVHDETPGPYRLPGVPPGPPQSTTPANSRADACRRAGGKRTGSTKAIRAVFAKAGRPLRPRDVVELLGGAHELKTVTTAIAKMRDRGELVQDFPYGPSRLPSVAPATAAPIKATPDQTAALDEAHQTIYRLRRERDDAVLELTARGKAMSVLRRDRDRLARENADLRSRVAAARHALGSRKAMTA